MDGVRRCHASAMRRVREFQVRDTSPVEEIVIFSGIDDLFSSYFEPPPPSHSHSPSYLSPFWI